MASDAHNKDYGFPRPGDRFFSTAEHSNTIITTNYNERRRTLIRGYRKAAEHIVLASLTQKAHDDVLVYPIVFLYRHVFELCLKSIVEISGRRFGIQIKYDHELPHQWKACELILKNFDLWHEGFNDNVTRLFEELDGVDPRSFAFRYPAFTNKKKVIGITLDSLRYLDLRQFVDTADRLASYLDYLCDEVGNREQYYLELEAEQRTF